MKKLSEKRKKEIKNHFCNNGNKTKSTENL